MVAKVAFEVISEFVFEETVALVATNKLTGAVENLSKATDDAIFGVARLGMAYAKNFLTGGAGFLGFMGAAIKSSETFRKTQIELANTMLTNKFSVNGEVLKFNDALTVADTILGKINAKAKRFGISPQALASSTSMFAKVLGPKGLAGDNMSNAMNLARVTVKGVPALDMDQNNAQGQILNALGGQLSKQTIFGSRLFAEAGDAMTAATDGVVTNIKSFNKASKQVRLTALIAGLDKMSGSMDIVGLRSNLLANKMMAIRDALFGVGSILKPLGDSLRKIIGPILDAVLKQITTKGPLIVKLMNNMFKRMGESPRELFLTVKGFANLHGDVTKAGKALRFLATSIMVLGAAASIGAIRSFTVRLIKMRGVIGFLSLGFAKFSRMFTGLLGRGLLMRFAMLIPTFTALIMVFQIFSRAADKMKLQFLDLLDVFGGKFVVEIDKFMNLLAIMISPLNEVVEIFSDLIVWATDLESTFSGVLDLFKSVNKAMEFFAIAIGSVMIAIQTAGAGIGAFLGSIMGIIQNPSLLVTGDSDIFKNTFGAMDNQMNKGIDELVAKLLSPEDNKKAIAKNIINADVKNTFNIKEKIEPDRIAFTLTEQLNKLGENRRSAIGRPLIPVGGI